MLHCIQFSEKDAAAYGKYEDFLSECRELVQPLLDNAPVNPFSGRFREKLRSLSTAKQMSTRALRYEGGLIAYLKDVAVPFYELFTGPASHILDRWFESEVLKTTLATDAVIGALVSPNSAGSAYVLLHHVKNI